MNAKTDILTNQPSLTDEDKLRTRNFEFICSTNVYDGKTSDREVALLKSRRILENYRDLLTRFDAKNIFEIGFFQGALVKINY